MVTILMPCYNEENTIEEAIEKAKVALNTYNIDGEILIVNNNSSDESKQKALANNVRVIDESNIGYGYALRSGIKQSQGDIIIMLDCDCSYDIMQINLFLNAIDSGSDFVCGNRYHKGIERGALPITHRIGGEIISIIGNILYGTHIHDYNCGIRGFKKDIFSRTEFKTSGMEFATEMICEAAKNKAVINEIKINYNKDKRGCKSKLRPLKDGIRHIKYLIGGYK